jgi:hypothetical protein
VIIIVILIFVFRNNHLNVFDIIFVKPKLFNWLMPTLESVLLGIFMDSSHF